MENGEDEDSSGTKNVAQAVGDSKTKNKVIVDDPELDALLDEALLDFDKPIPKPKVKPGGGGGNFDKRFLAGAASDAGAGDEYDQVWTEEFIKEATAQFEKKMRECMSGPGALNPPSALPENLNKVVEAATRAAVGNSVEPSALASQINEALKGFTTIPEGSLGEGPAFSDNDLSKLMNSFSMGENVGDGEMDEILPFMTNVMQKLLSKDLLYPVMTDIVDRYPEWLAENRPKISPEEFDKYNRQYDFMKRICEEYSSEKETDSADVKRDRFDRISQLMLKVQCTGPPPTDLVGEEGSPFPSVDPFGSGVPGDQCSIA